jgi:type I restriction enzyme M protein
MEGKTTMIDTKKEQERDELHRAIWAIADELRGAVDGWDFKNYVLGTMFYRYISENLCNYINGGEMDAGNTEFDYAKISDEEAEEAREGLVQEKGFFILPSELFCNVRERAANDENLNETLEKVFQHIEDSAKGSEAENDFAGLFDDFDVNSNKLGSTVAKRNEKLVKLLNGVAQMNLGDVKDHDIDAFGDAYEYLMTMYASNAGKSGGEFFTPADVSELLTRLGIVGKTEINKVYDPACGTGGMLTVAEDRLGRMNKNAKLICFGQEINPQTYAICKSDILIKGANADYIKEGNTLSGDLFSDDKFDYILSNPPFGREWKNEKTAVEKEQKTGYAGRFGPGTPAIGDSQMLFLLTAISKMKDVKDGGSRVAIIHNGSPLFTGDAGSGPSEIRKYIIENDLLEAIIALPNDIFYNTGIATYIWVLSNKKASHRKGKVQLINANEMYEKRRKSLGACLNINRKQEKCI